MSYDVSAFLENLKSVFLTSTAGLCASVSANVNTITTDSILIGNPTRLTRQIDQYPCLILNPKQKAQNWDEIGMQSSRSSREITIGVDILAMSQVTSDSEDADKQCRVLARNIENVLETNIERSASTSTVEDGWHICLVKNTVFDGAYNESKQTYQSSVRIEAEFKSYSIRN